MYCKECKYVNHGGAEDCYSYVSCDLIKKYLCTVYQFGPDAASSQSVYQDLECSVKPDDIDKKIASLEEEHNQKVAELERFKANMDKCEKCGGRGRIQTYNSAPKGKVGLSMNSPRMCVNCFGTGSKDKNKILATIEKSVKRTENNVCVETDKE